MNQPNSYPAESVNLYLTQVTLHFCDSTPVVAFGVAHYMHSVMKHIQTLGPLFQQFFLNKSAHMVCQCW